MRAQADSAFQKYLLTAERTENNKDHATYAYYFRQVPPGRNSEFRGAYHSSELWFMFDSIREGAAHREWTESDYRMADIMSTYWMNFVKYSNPTGPEADVAGKTLRGNDLQVWEPCTKDGGLKFMELGDGASKLVQNTAYPERDAHHRKVLQEKLEKLL